MACKLLGRWWPGCRSSPLGGLRLIDAPRPELPGPDWVRLKTVDLELGAGVNLTPGKPIEGRHMLLHGKFAGNAILAGTWTVHADGDFSGKLKAAGLCVEEGGGLRAQLDVNPDYAPPPPKPKNRPPPRPNTKLRPPPPQARAAKPPAAKKKASEPRKKDKE